MVATQKALKLSGAALALALGLTALPALSPSAQARVNVEIIVPMGPPAVRYEPPPPPHRHPGRYAWQAGHWRWNGHDYVWVQGHYVKIPRHRGHWDDGHWEQRPGGWVWVDGRWR